MVCHVGEEAVKLKIMSKGWGRPWMPATAISRASFQPPNAKSCECKSKNFWKLECGLVASDWKIVFAAVEGRR